MRKILNLSVAVLSLLLILSVAGFPETKITASWSNPSPNLQLGSSNANGSSAIASVSTLVSGVGSSGKLSYHAFQTNQGEYKKAGINAQFYGGKYQAQVSASEGNKRTEETYQYFETWYASNASFNAWASERSKNTAKSASNFRATNAVKVLFEAGASEPKGGPAQPNVDYLNTMFQGTAGGDVSGSSKVKIIGGSGPTKLGLGASFAGDPTSTVGTTFGLDPASNGSMITGSGFNSMVEETKVNAGWGFIGGYK